MSLLILLCSLPPLGVGRLLLFMLPQHEALLS
jgi:hypothetical protein